MKYVNVFNFAELVAITTEISINKSPNLKCTNFQNMYIFTKHPLFYNIGDTIAFQ
jgi:hypothetical protein